MFPTTKTEALAQIAELEAKLREGRSLLETMRAGVETTKRSIQLRTVLRELIAVEWRIDLVDEPAEGSDE